MGLSSLRHAVVSRDDPLARSLRWTRQAVLNVHLPLPRPLLRPLIFAFLGVRSVWHLLRRIVIVEPFFRGSCTRVGRNLRTGIFLPWISGSGEIILGDNCNIVGKFDVAFAARFSDRPTLRIGSNTGIGHLCSFVVAKRITIGDYCHIAGGTRIFDSSGHPLDPAQRKANRPPSSDDVRPVTIGDNVWIGAHSVIFPGVTVGDNSVVATGSVVTGDVPPNTMVAGYPARMVRRFD